MDKYEVTETCPYCDAEVTMQWNTAVDGYQAYCPYCGGRLMLCDACQHRLNGEYIGDCDYCTKTDSCRFNKYSKKNT